MIWNNLVLIVISYCYGASRIVIEKSAYPTDQHKMNLTTRKKKPEGKENNE